MGDKETKELDEVVMDGEDNAYDLPCKFAYRVESHSVYCHSEKAPNRKCPLRHTGEFSKCEFFKENK